VQAAAHNLGLILQKLLEKRPTAGVRGADAARDPAAIAAASEMFLALRPIELRPILERLTLRAQDLRSNVMHGSGEGI
jgi:hypothetical protein